MVKGNYISSLFRAVKYIHSTYLPSYRSKYKLFKKYLGVHISPYNYEDWVELMSDYNNLCFNNSALFFHLCKTNLDMQVCIRDWDDFLTFSELGRKYGLCWDCRRNVANPDMVKELYDFFVRHDNCIYISISISHRVRFDYSHYWGGQDMYSLKKFMRRYERFVKAMDDNADLMFRMKLLPDVVKPNPFRWMIRWLKLKVEKLFNNKTLHDNE